VFEVGQSSARNVFGAPACTDAQWRLADQDSPLAEWAKVCISGSLVFKSGSISNKRPSVPFLVTPGRKFFHTQPNHIRASEWPKRVVSSSYWQA
jgi:hypothetical protein